MLKVSLSWLAKARMRGDGPPYIRVGRSIRYAEAALVQWMKSQAALLDQRAIVVIGPNQDVSGVSNRFSKVIVRKPE